MSPTTFLQKIRKRNGAIVDFSSEKVMKAMKKAFLEVRGGVDELKMASMSEHVIRHLEKSFGEDAVPSVEHVQNTVESVLMEEGYYDVAKAYIIYRYQHEKERAQKKQEVIEKIEQDGLFVTKRNGQRERFSDEKLREYLTRFIGGFENVIDVEMLVKQCRVELFEHITTKEISQALALVTRACIEQDPAYSKVAARIVLDMLYKDAISGELEYERFEEQYRAAFKTYIYKGVELGRLDPRMLVFPLDELAARMDIARDDLFDYIGIQTLCDRYFVRDPNTGQLFETPQFFFMRIAMGHAILEKDKLETTTKFYEIMSTLRYMSSTPTLFHAGLTNPQLSSCYLTTVEDDLQHIFKCLGDNAQMSKWSGGLGNDWTNLRGTGAQIKTTAVESQGVIPFLKIANDVTVAINRSGKRRGATCAYLETWHIDIEDFIELRRNTGDERRRTHDMNTSNWIPDLFMKRVREDGQWTLFSPDETPDLHHIYGSAFEEQYIRYEQMAKEGRIRLFKTIKAKDLWRKMISMLYETGHPWITFKDPCNVRSPQDHAGVIHSSNLCTEITLNTSSEETAVCNLGSLNLDRLVVNGVLDEGLVKDTVKTAMRMLDNVIDINFYPTKEGKKSNMRHRPVGLGVRGFQDALYLQGINFTSDECVEFADSSMEMISYYTILASSDLARQRGAYRSFRGSKWDRGILPLDTLDLLEKERGEKIHVSRTSRYDWNEVRSSIKKHGMRNSNCIAVAPSASTATLCGCFPTIEPIYKNLYVKSNMSGEFTVINKYLVEDLKKLNLWNAEMVSQLKQHDGSVEHITVIPQNLREKYKEVFEVGPQWLIKAAAHRGKWVDQSQSLNVFYKGSSGKELSDIYFYAWSMGLKTTYYLRTMAASHVEKSTVNLNVAGESNASSRLMATTGPVKACAIDDPTCEACES
ncbi:MAG: ribonucleoside-diphosphate reductase subunit alpha [Candidatus Magasanikbacteria bacterium]|jgi:ribonucleoside-diphosphate reductase alpha chain|nr:ribonucleoside-diphosphate reductase subunit alpha [Candidatus Magasanikbacteria bacterium]MBT4220986.1 ribonucleoside-diphosphate reductase subunit alpha [Candidatus Magasanikbacteria bacterium]MBT4350504.1 ribonucleoside-diphosphate reductase subunit alpha [Candidatus Magasanikbacteria bacterium]MBT4541943.1 ribonucleoside-diphosphate reductase subunit alpha [Candidatus Magasanikbacteria bacterium]MBT6252891.1 ribonucleoside-diphosphate reductase subunit alpha [Candidatus Magasanikbacteria